MINMLRKKKGLSPLIATVLLIAFAVGVSALVLVWGRGFFTNFMQQADAETTERLTCSDAMDMVGIVGFIDGGAAGSHLPQVQNRWDTIYNVTITMWADSNEIVINGPEASIAPNTIATVGNDFNPSGRIIRAEAVFNLDTDGDVGNYELTCTGPTWYGSI